MNSGKVIVVVGGGFGSEGKGAIAARLCAEQEEVLAIRVAGPNAGHSAVAEDGHKWALRQIPVAAVSNRNAKLLIAPGSEIDPEVLETEIRLLDGAGYDVSRRLHIDAQATIIEDRHKEAETALIGKIGSTGKGIGAARAERLMRQALLWGQMHEDACDGAHMAAAWLKSGRPLLIEGTQGYGLGLHAGWYPKCTSSDARAIDFLSMVGISPWAPWVKETEVWVVMRTYPIRVAGDSGPMYKELSWEELGKRTKGYIRPEHTTVTKKVRRVGEWDAELATRAVAENGGRNVTVALTMFDYWYPELAGCVDGFKLTPRMWDRIHLLEREIGAQIGMLGTGPDSAIDLREWHSDRRQKSHWTEPQLELLT